MFYILSNMDKLLMLSVSNFGIACIREQRSYFKIWAYPFTKAACLGKKRYPKEANERVKTNPTPIPRKATDSKRREEEGFHSRIAPGLHIRGFSLRFSIPFVQESKLLRAEKCNWDWHSPRRTRGSPTNKLLERREICTICVNMSFIKTSLKLV